MTSLQFATWSSDIELQFYAALASLKINHDRLNDSARKVLGLYEVRPNERAERSSRMQIHGTALTTDEIPGGYYRAEGWIKNYNTFEEYKSADRSKIIELAARTIWDAIQDETIYSCPSLLCSFYAISFANLKKYRFTYHFAFPALHSDPTWKSVDEVKKLQNKETQLLVDSVQTWRYSVDPRQHGFFLAKRVHRGQNLDSEENDEDQRPKTPVTPGLAEELGYTWSVNSLQSFKNGFFNGVEKQDQYICFADSSNFDQNPGWPLRNLLVLIRQLYRLDDVQIICYRDTHSRRDQANSLIFHLQSSSSSSSTLESPVSTDGNSTDTRPSPKPLPKVTGWERAENGKLTSKTVDLAAYMDPTRLADQAVDLNLKLMKWRIAPSIDLDVVKNTSCLLLGAGTLGSYVSRNLMGWGVRKISFIDNATVSFSNPVRQPLYDFKDCLDGGAKKAHRAADVLSEIYPGVESKGHVMSVPMVGHPVVDEAKIKEEYELLKKLIDEHDVLILMLDTREARWLPTVMGKAAGKIVLNAALGFDTYMVMRHGLKPNHPEKGEVEVGCYFCNDVVAPADSLKDATLDQQCTVTRPGAAPIASALLVELLISILQHPLKARAPPTKSATEQTTSAFTPSSTTTTTASPSAPSSNFIHPLGALPHTIRGFLSSFSQLQINGQPYDCCSACSERVTSRYIEEGWEFVRRCLVEKGYVEEVSGLAEVQRRAEEADKDVEWDESDGEEGEGELL